MESKNEGLAPSPSATSTDSIHLQESAVAMKRKLSELEKQLLQQHLLEVRKGCHVAPKIPVHRGLGAGALVVCVWWLAEGNNNSGTAAATPCDTPSLTFICTGKGG